MNTTFKNVNSSLFTLCLNELLEKKPEHLRHLPLNVQINCLEKISDMGALFKLAKQFNFEGQDELQKEFKKRFIVLCYPEKERKMVKQDYQKYAVTIAKSVAKECLDDLVEGVNRDVHILWLLDEREGNMNALLKRHISHLKHNSDRMKKIQIWQPSESYRKFTHQYMPMCGSLTIALGVFGLVIKKLKCLPLPLRLIIGAYTLQKTKILAYEALRKIGFEILFEIPLKIRNIAQSSSIATRFNNGDTLYVEKVTFEEFIKQQERLRNRKEDAYLTLKKLILELIDPYLRNDLPLDVKKYEIIHKYAKGY